MSKVVWIFEWPMTSWIALGFAPCVDEQRSESVAALMHGQKCQQGRRSTCLFGSLALGGVVDHP